MVARQRLPSATYHSPSEESWTRDIFADQMIAVHACEHAPADIARHVAEKQLSRAPFFVMNVPAVLEAVDVWQGSMGRFQPFYSLRCNADPVLAQLLAETDGMGFEVRNQKELAVALELVDPSKIIYAHGMWTAKSMRLAGAARVGTIVVSTEKELRDATHMARDARILLDVAVPGYTYLDEDNCFSQPCTLKDAAALLKTADDHLANFVGFTFNIDNSDSNGYYRAMQEIKKFWKLAEQNRLRPTTIAVGGGFTYPKSKDSHYYEVVRDLHDAIDCYFPQVDYPSLQLVASPGNFFAAAAFSLCTNVIARREVELNDSNVFLYQTNEDVDGAFCGVRYHDQTPDFKPLHDKENPESLGVLLGCDIERGPVPQHMFRTRQLAVGDWLYWENMGAFTMSVDDVCLSHPVYYFSGKENWELINKRRNSFAELETNSEMGSDAASDVNTDDEDDNLMALFN